MKRFKTVFAVVLPLLAIGLVANAADKTWDAGNFGIGTNWGSATLWDPTGVPVCADTAIIADDSIAQPKLNQNRQVTLLYMYDGTDAGSPVSLDLNGYKLEVMDTFWVGDSSSTLENYVEIKNTSMAGSDPGDLQVTAFVLEGPDDADAEVTTLEVNPANNDVTIVTVGSLSCP